MRVIGGNYKGLKLTSNKKINSKSGEFLIRPTSDRTKETLFNMIQNSFKLNLQGTSFLDFFSGTGSIGIEAISRGSKCVYFIDSEKSSCDQIRENLSLLFRKTGLEKVEAQVLKKDFFDNELFFERKFDFIYLDPPYKKFLIEDVIKRLIELNVMKKSSLIIYESDLGAIGFSNLNLLDSRRIGKTFISFYEISH